MASNATTRDAIALLRNSAPIPNSARARIEGRKPMTPVFQRILLACLAFGGIACAPAVGAEDITVKVGTVRSITTATILWASEKGYFKDYGIKVGEREPRHRRQFASQLLAQNQLQIVEGGISAGYFNALEKDLPVTIALDRVTSPLGHNLMIRADLKDQITEHASSSRARSSPATAAARSPPTKSARSWRQPGLTHPRRRHQVHSVPAIRTRVRPTRRSTPPRHPAVYRATRATRVAP